MTTAETLQEARELLNETLKKKGVNLGPMVATIIEADKAKDELIKELVYTLKNVKDADHITSCQECGFGSSSTFEQVLEVIESANKLGYKP